MDVMPKKPAKPAKASALRRRAEERLRTTKREVAAMSTKDVQQLVHELQVHQLELEMQNEELRQAQVELEAARERYVYLYEFSPVGHLTLDTQGHILEANAMTEALLGLTRNKLSGKPLVRLIAGEDQDVFHHHVQQVLKGGTEHVCEVRLQNKSGIACWVLLKSRGIFDESGHPTHWQTAVLDTNVRKGAEVAMRDLNATLEQRVKERTGELERINAALRASEEHLHRQQAKLEELPVKLLMAEESERRRIAQELHDDITQRLAALTIDLRYLRLQGSPVSELDQLYERTKQLTTDVQCMSHQLHPPLLDHLGLAEAVHDHVEEFAARTGLSTQVVVRRLPPTIPVTHATCLYRVLQESLQNIHKHAKATSVVIRLLQTKRGIGLSLSDDGQGLEVDQQHKRPSGLGLASMAERVEILKGTFRLKANPGQGTEVYAWVPLDQHAASCEGG